MGLRISVLLLGLGALLFAPSRADACSCVGGIPLCQSFWTTDAVFSGEVLSIEPFTNPSGAGFQPHRRVRIRVIESWRGGVSGVIEVTTGAGGGDCGYSFTRGRSYLVYAHARNGVLNTSICTRTRLLSEASNDLTYLRTAMSRPSLAGRIFGTAQYQRQWDPNGPTPPRFINGYTVTLTGGSGTRTTTTGADGEYEFVGVPAGEYTVALRTPEWELAHSSTVTLADPRGCAAADFYVVPNGRIHLRLVDAAGNPLKGISLELIDRERVATGKPVFATRTLETNDEGGVEFDGLHPKGYSLGINTTRPPDASTPFRRTFFPGVASAEEARVIHLGLGERVDLGTWKLSGRLAERRVTGRVVLPDGQPAARARVVATTTSESWPFQLEGGSTITAEDGTFTLTLVAGRDYDLQAYTDVGERGPEWGTKLTPLKREDGARPVVLRLERTKRRD